MSKGRCACRLPPRLSNNGLDFMRNLQERIELRKRKTASRRSLHSQTGALIRQLRKQRSHSSPESWDAANQNENCWYRSAIDHPGTFAAEFRAESASGMAAAAAAVRCRPVRTGAVRPPLLGRMVESERGGSLRRTGAAGARGSPRAAKALENYHGPDGGRASEPKLQRAALLHYSRGAPFHR